MRNTDDEVLYWNTWVRLPPLASLMMFLMLISGVNAIGLWNSTLTNQTNFTFSNNGTDLGPTVVSVYAPEASYTNSLRFAYSNGSNFNPLQFCQKMATGNGWISVLIPTIPSGANTSTIVAVWNSTGESHFVNGSNCAGVFSDLLEVPNVLNYTSTVQESALTAGIRFSLGPGGGSGRSDHTGANLRYYYAAYWISNANATATRPSVCWGNPSSGPYTCFEFGASSSKLGSSWGGDSTTTASPALGSTNIIELDMNTTRVRGRMLYADGTIGAWLNITGSVPTTADSINGVGLDANQQVDIYFVGVADGQGGRNITYLNSSGSAFGSIAISLSSPVSGSSFTLANTTLGLSFNCSGDSNSDYLANITFNGVVNQTGITCYANQTTNASVNVSALGSYVWSVLAYNSTTSTNSSNSNFSIVDYVSNISVNYTTPQYDIYSYIHQLNLTMVGATDVNAVINVDGTNTSVAKSVVGNLYTFTATMTPPQVSYPTDKNFTWYYLLTLPNGSVQSVSNNTYLVNVEPGGLITCNGTYSLQAVNYSFVDQSSGAQVNATFSSSYTGAVNRSRSGQDKTYTWCIAPNNGSITVTTSETYTATGYSPIITSRVLVASNTTTNITIYMLNSTAGTATTLSLQQLPNIPLSGQTIIISQYTAPSNYTVVRSCVTGAAGTCLVYLEPNTIYYFYNMTGLNTTFGPEVLVCTPGSSTCYRNFFIGSSVSIPGTASGQVSGSCTYSSATGYITCNGAGSISQLLGFGLVLFRNGETTSTCANTTYGMSGVLTCAVPQTNNTRWSYLLYSIETVTNESITGGEIAINITRTASLGRDSWFIMLFLFLFLAAVGAAHPLLGVTFGVLGMLLGVFVGIVPFDAVSATITVTAIAAGVIIYKLRV